jgi:uncharacterized protein
MVEVNFVGKCLLLENKNERVLVVGDLHIGYEEALEQNGIFIGRNSFNEMIREFDDVFDEVDKKFGKVGKIVLLGDVKHVFGRPERQEWDDVLKLFDYFLEKIGKGGEIIVVKGNHDNYLANIAGKKSVKVFDTFIWEGVGFIHGHKKNEGVLNEEIKIIFLGHFHPAITLKDGAKEERYKCFLDGKWNGKRVIVVPSFSNYSEGGDVRDIGVDRGMKDEWGFDLKKFDVKVVSERLKVLDFGKLGKM